MTIAEAVAKSVESLPLDKQREVMDFAEFLKASVRSRPRRMAKTLEGLWAGMGIQPVSEEDMRQARKEMWGNFPREFPS
jgi:hypothetical protein